MSHLKGVAEWPNPLHRTKPNRTSPPGITLMKVFKTSSARLILLPSSLTVIDDPCCA
ncbi:hypothetical protein [Methyloglobulus sp.]|uniref:hypothetical protein n=1 Tax=Methyloglobulus sp. TaxID=2518622 RepID=UPI00398A0B9B